MIRFIKCKEENNYINKSINTTNKIIIILFQTKGKIFKYYMQIARGNRSIDIKLKIKFLT